MAIRSKIAIAKSKESNSKDWLFRIFCAWAVVFICRPQDFLPFLNKFRPALLGVALTMALFLIRLPSLQHPKYMAEKQIKRYLALVAVMVAGIPFSFYARLSFMMVFTSYINTVVFVLIFYKVVNSVTRLTHIFFLCCLGSGFYAAFAVLKGHMIGGRLTFGGVFDPNDLAFYVLGFLPLNLIFLSKDNPLWARLACLGSMGASALLILLTGSRGGLIAFGIAVFMILFRKTQTITTKMKMLTLSVCLVFLITAPINIERFTTILHLGSDYNVSDETGRMTIWKSGMRAMLSNPLTGVGVGCFGEAVGRDRLERGARTLAWQAPHNSVVQIATETGVLGMLLYLTMSFGIWRTFLRGARGAREESLKKNCEMGLIGFTGLFVSGLLLSQAYAASWAFYLAVSTVINRMLPAAEVLPNRIKRRMECDKDESKSPMCLHP